MLYKPVLKCQEYIMITASLLRDSLFVLKCQEFVLW